MSRLFVTVFAFCSLLALSVDGRVYSNHDHVIFPDSPDSQLKISRVLSNNLYYDAQRRTTRQSNNRRVTDRQQSPTTDEEDPFSGLDPSYPGNQPFNGNQGQWFNNGNPNSQTEQQSFGSNWPQQQSQWPNNGQNQGQGLQGNNGGSQGQDFGNWPQEQNQWPNNGQNQGQGLQGNNGNNRPNNRPNRPNRPTNQNQNNQNSNNQNNQNQNNQNQNQAQTSSAEASETQRNECNTRCKERVTNEFNPVCGNDSQTYQNRRFLECVAGCGIRTEFSYVGTCVTTTQRSVERSGSSNARRT